MSYWSFKPLISYGFSGPWVANSSIEQAKISVLILILLTMKSARKYFKQLRIQDLWQESDQDIRIKIDYDPFFCRG